MKKKAAAKNRIVLYLQDEAYKQLLILEETFSMVRSSVVSQALARWYHEEPLVKGKITKRRRTEPQSSNGVDKTEGT